MSASQSSQQTWECPPTQWPESPRSCGLNHLGLGLKQVEDSMDLDQPAFPKAAATDSGGTAVSTATADSGAATPMEEGVLVKKEEPVTTLPGTICFPTALVTGLSPHFLCDHRSRLCFYCFTALTVLPCVFYFTRVTSTAHTRHMRTTMRPLMPSQLVRRTEARRHCEQQDTFCLTNLLEPNRLASRRTVDHTHRLSSL